jgi:hypothetical protein
MHKRGLALLLVTMGLSACGGSTPFAPAAQPADVCSVLTLADVQTVFATAAPGAAAQSATSSDFWMLECDWHDGAASATSQEVSLVVYGALTSTGDADLDAALARSGDGAQQAMPVSHVGEQAVYADFAGPYDVHQSLGARSGPYWVSLTAWNFPSLCAAPQLDPLVVKALGEL